MKNQTTVKKTTLKSLIIETAKRLNLIADIKNYGVIEIVKKVRKKLDSNIFDDPQIIIEDCILDISF